ncbi:MAG TPA: hypothetical protein DCG53_14890 [Syntrophus sp. (in: bacteria)]|nr:hypothetical protein [Syntrophus sp. (in: bacteria)]
MNLTTPVLFKGLWKTDVHEKLDWRYRLDQAGERIMEMTTGTEGEFLRIGERLQEIHQRARAMSKLSGAAVEQLSGDTILTQMEGLKKILRQIGDENESSLGGSATIAMILQRLKEVHGHLESFDKIVRNLRVLCNLIRIESARLGNQHEGFAALGDDVQGLIAHVDTGSSTLRMRTEEIIRLLADHMALAKEFETSQQENTKLILDQSRRNIGEMEARHELSSQVIKDAAVRWKQISGSVGEVVSSLQFHDITRQRMEHVREALMEMMGERKNTPELPERKSLIPWPLRGHRENNGISDTTDVMSKAAVTCELQTAQLQHAREDLAGAVERIGENLYRISSEISVMSEDIQKAAGASGEKEDTYFSELEASLAKLMEAIGEFAEMNRKMSGSMLQVAHAMGEMTSFIRDIQKVGIAMRVTALNACIHAAHIGDSGLALGVLADSIHDLSVNTEGSIDIISTNLACIGGEAESLSRQGGRYDQERLERENTSLLDQVKSLMQPLRQMDEELSDLLQRFDSDGADLQQEIEEMAAHLRVHDEMDRGIGAVVTSLKGVTDDMHAALPAGSELSKAAVLGDMAARYTMVQERKIHMAVAGAAPVAAIGVLPMMVEEGEDRDMLDGTREDAEAATAAGGDEGDLGDNVELF